MNQPLVSIVAASFNHAPYLRACLDGILHQTYENWEINIVDDGSTDGSLDIIREYVDRDARIKLFRNEFNMGVSATFNRSARLANGEYCSILATDDIYLPTKIAQQVAYLQEHPDCGACFSHINIIDENGIEYEHNIKHLVNSKNSSRSEMLRRFFFEGNFLASPTEMIRTEIFQSMNYYQNGLILTADYESHIRVLNSHSIHIIQEPLVSYRIRKDASNTSAPSEQNSFRSKTEMDVLLNTFLDVTDIDLFNDAFPDEIDQYGIATVETIPYLFSRIALDTKYPEWGYKTLIRLIGDDLFYTKINRLYNFIFKDFLYVCKSASIVDKHKRKSRKYRRLLVCFFILLLLSVLVNIYFLIH